MRLSNWMCPVNALSLLALSLLACMGCREAKPDPSVKEAPEQRRAVGAKILVAGGSTLDGQGKGTAATSTVSFDPQNGTLAQLPDQPAYGFDASTGRWQEGGDPANAEPGKVDDAIGDDPVALVGPRRLASFDPFTKTWRAWPALPTPRSDAAVVRLSDGTVLVAGGTGMGGRLLDSSVRCCNVSRDE